MSKWQILELFFWGMWVIVVAFIGHWAVINNSMLGLGPGLGFYIAGFGIGPPGLYYAAVRAKISQEQSRIDKQRLVSEDFSRSVKLLGDDSPAVRQGGIYALGFLAQESKDRHATAIKIVASYIRETGKYNKRQKTESKEINIAPDGVDVEAALSVIKNRNTNWDETPDREGEYMFDLSSSLLRFGDLSNAKLGNVNLSEIDAGGSIFAKTVFSKANMVGATFRGCDFENAKFHGAQLRESRFWHDNGLGGECNFRGVDLTEAELYAADLRGADNLTQQQIDSAKGDNDTKLPGHIKPPASWLGDSCSQE